MAGLSDMIIGVDIRVLVLGRKSGIEEYLLNLLPKLIEKNPEVTFRLFYNALEKRGLPYDWLGHPNVRLLEFRIPNRFFLFPANLVAGWPHIDHLIGGCDVFWSPHIFNAALSRNVRHVITVHDLAFERHPECFPLEKRLWHRYLMAPKRQMRRASRLITVSHSTKRDLENLYRVPAGKVRVIYPGVAEEFRRLDPQDPRRAIIREKYRLPDRFFLFFGTIEPRKNIAGLIEAFGMLRGEARGPKLVIAGEKGWLCEDVFTAAKKSPRAGDIAFTGFIDEDDKPALYNLADVFVYPSLFEGFGFPPLEAMACGVPVITSNRASLPEVAGDAAILIDPYRPAEIAEAIATLLTDRKARDTMVQRGLERAGQFSWDLCAKETMRILQDRASN